MHRIHTSLFLSLILLTGCASYHPEPIHTPHIDEWKSGCASESSVAFREKWWEIFGDPFLNELEEKALANSPSLLLAVDRIREREGFFQVERAPLFPHLQVGGSISRTRVPDSSVPLLQMPRTPGSSVAMPPPFAPLNIPPGPVPPPIALGSHYQTEYKIAPRMTYEIDFWGKYMNATRASLEDIKSAKEDYLSAILILTTEVALRYFELQATDAELDVTQRTIDAYKEQIAINKASYEAGLKSQLEQLQAEFEYQSVRAEYIDILQRRTLLENLLASTIGIPASSFHLPKLSFENKWLIIAPQLPSEILKQRPDIRSLENQIERERLRVGSAKALFFPSVPLYAEAGHLSDSLSSLFDWKNRILSLTASFLMPVFEGGRLKGQVNQAKARYEAALHQYLDGVIIAFKEVENALFVMESSKELYGIRQLEFRAAQDQRDLTKIRYDNGLIDFLNVIFAERSLLDSEKNLIRTSRNQIFATVSLIKSLGGSWEEHYQKPTLPENARASVPPSTYSNTLPTGMPKAILEQDT